MKKSTVIALILAVILIAFIPLFALKDAEFGGSDDAGSSYNPNNSGNTLV